MQGEETALAHAIQVFKALVVAHLNRMATGTEARILNFFEPGPAAKEAAEAQVV